MKEELIKILRQFEGGNYDYGVPDGTMVHSDDYEECAEAVAKFVCCAAFERLKHQGEDFATSDLQQMGFTLEEITKYLSKPKTYPGTVTGTEQ